ncbi:MAG: 5-formyltetrahydrofolate cyclo-ligase [Clostridia bacterium]|nr:5-formyltetrahydrofolate cyclo-ligase [Clostridia bacterium]
MKNKIREEMKQKRRNMMPEEVFEKSQMAQKIFLESEQYKNAKAIMLYLPLGNEVDTKAIINNAFSLEKKVLVPVTDSKTFEITAFKITEGMEFEKGTFSVKEPKERISFELSKIDVVLVPGIAFDRDGGRIGFGKGCYDKFLKGIKAVKIGFCYDFQLVDSIETDENDVSMDYVITEKEIIRGKL